jgi:hypothetical protein
MFKHSNPFLDLERCILCLLICFNSMDGIFWNGNHAAQLNYSFRVQEKVRLSQAWRVWDMWQQFKSIIGHSRDCNLSFVN